MTAAHTTQDILAALRRRHQREGNGATPAWVYAAELRVSVGFSNFLTPKERAAFTAAGFPYLNPDSRLDAFALHTWPSRKHERVAYEVKASRSDLQRELKDPAKRQTGLALSNRWYLVVAADVTMVKYEIPDEAGLIRWHPDSGLRQVKEAPWRTVPDLPYSTTLSLLRTVQRRAWEIERRHGPEVARG